MAAKRRAGSQLTQDNWEEEEEVVEDASFRVADNTVLAKRKMKKATRRIGASAGASKPSPFGAFKGFSSSAPSGSTSTDKPAFGGFQVSSSKPGLGGSGFQVSSSKPLATNTPALTFGTGVGSSRSADLPSSTAPSVGSDTNKVEVKPTLNGGATAMSSNSPSSEYASKLRELNRSVSAWIQEHIAKTPVCDLTPVFEDYRKHIAEIERKYGSGRANTSQSGIANSAQSGIANSAQSGSANSAQSGSANSAQSSAASGGLPFGVQGTKNSVPRNQEEAKKPSFGGFSFGAQSAGQSEVEAKKDTGLFGKASSKITFGSSAVTFGSTAVTGSSGLTFPLVSAEPKKTVDEQKKAVDEDEPPKPEVKVVEEKDALFSIRSKLYYKNDSGQFTERGVGMLHLKKPGSNGQILLRADTTLGNIIFNISIPKLMPVQRQGKNNVMLMAAMNPPPDKACPQCEKKYVDPQTSNACQGGCTPKARPILLRVKTGDDADKLLEEINKLKK